MLGRKTPELDHEPHLIDNPLRDVPPPALLRQARQFAKLVDTEAKDGLVARSLRRLACRFHLSRPPISAQTATDDGSLEDTNKDLTDLFEKAALIAQNPQKLEVLGLTSHEVNLLKHDREVKFWNQPKMLRVTIVTLVFSAIIQGWIQSGSNGANQNWPAEFGLVDADGAWKGRSEEWIFASVNAVTYLAASIFGCWLSDPLQSMILGRRGAIFISALLCFISLIGAAFTQNWQQLLICRALVGLGMGAKASVTPIFGAEASPSHLRGALVMNWQLFDAFGIFLGHTANIIFSYACPASLSWRLQLASACIPSACLLTLIWTIPESPRWLLKRRQHRKAFKALCSLRETHLQAAVELFYANAQLQIEASMQSPSRTDVEKATGDGNSQHIERIDIYRALNSFQDSSARTNYFSRIWQLFRQPRTRRATVAASVVMISQQLCGINVIAFYSSTFFRDTDGPKSIADVPSPEAVRALWLSWGVGLANFIFTFPAYYLIDRKGRRFLLFWTYPGMTLSMLGACLSFLSEKGLAIKVSIFMFLFVFFYSWGQGPVAFAYSSEVFPLINREAGMSFAVFVNLLGAGLLTLLVPLAQLTRSNAFTPNGTDDSQAYSIGQARLLGIFVAFNVLAMILIFFFMPETAGATIRKMEEDDHLSYMRLEELNYIFNVHTRDHVSYQIRHMIPHAGRMISWWVCYSVTRNAKKFKKPAAPKKMWVWVEMKEQKAKDQELSEESQSSGLDLRVGTTSRVGGSQAMQRNGVQIVSKE